MTYATIDDYREQTGDATTSDAEVTRLLEAAERDVDRAVGFHPTNEDTGLKFDPVTMHARDSKSIRRATIVQAQYRAAMGDEFFVKDQYAEVSGPEFTTKGKLARISPAVFDELQNGNVLNLSTSWKGAGDAPPWEGFARNVD